jgi:hypothetical protein
VVTPQGKAINPARHIEGARKRDIDAKLADLTPAALPSVEQARAAAGRSRAESGGRSAIPAGQSRKTANDNRSRPGPTPRERLELWANGKRAALQSTHLDQQVELERKQDRAALHQQAELDKAYGADEKACKAELAAIRARQRKGGLWYRLRHAADDRERAAIEKENLAQFAELRADYTAELETQQAGEREALHGQQERERADLERRIEQAGERLTEPSGGQERAQERPLSERVREAFEARQRADGRDRDRGFER